jgi:hypothetical protein
MLCVWPDGKITERAGRQVSRASLSPRLAKALHLLTSGISGPPGIGLSTSAALQSSLENRLQAKTASLGSTLYRLTWKHRAMPSGRLIYALRASVVRISDSDRTGWPTPSTMGSGNTGTAWEKRRERVKANYPNGHSGFGLILPMAASLTGWATTTTRDWKDTTGMATTGINPDGSTRNRLDRVGLQVSLCGWNTTRATDGSNGGPNQAGGALYPGAALAGWATPQCADDNMSRVTNPKAFSENRLLTRGAGQNLADAAQGLTMHPQAARLTATGEMLTGSTAGMENGGQLNPAHSRWLMGLPIAWDDCAATVMRSSRRSPKPSLKR